MDERDPSRRERDALDCERHEIEIRIEDSWEALGPYPPYDQLIDERIASAKTSSPGPTRRLRGRPKALVELRDMIREGLVAWFELHPHSARRPTQAQLCSLMPGGPRATTVSCWLGQHRRAGKSGGWHAEVERQWKDAYREYHIQYARVMAR
jgi:hypothetical protein